MTKLSKRDLKVPALLIALSLVPVLGGVMRFMSLSASALDAPDDARFARTPTPIVLHIVSATLFCLLGALQLAPALRLRWPSLHRRSGKLVVSCGLLAGATGLWMTAFYAIPVSMQGPLLHVVRLAVGFAMIAAILLAWSSIVRRDVAQHEAFMIRAYALGQGAGTQVLVLAPWMMISGKSGGLTRDVLMTLAWVINIVVAEWLIRSRTSGRP